MALLFLLLLALLAPSQQTAAHVSVRSLYISNPITWNPPPKDPELPKYESAFAALVVFLPSGEFAEGDFTLGRYGSKGAIFIIPAEGFALSKGRWSRNSDGSLTVKYQLVYKEKVFSGETVPGAIREERWVPRGKAAGRLGAFVESPSAQYLPVRDFSGLRTLDDILREKHPSSIP